MNAYDRFTPFSGCGALLRYLGVERQLSPITLLNYQRQLDAIIALAGETGLQSWQQCDASMVRSFAVRSRRKGLGPASLALRLSALRSFFDWLVNQGELKANPAKVFPRRKHRVIYLKISMSTTLIVCWISTSTIPSPCATGQC